MFSINSVFSVINVKLMNIMKKNYISPVVSELVLATQQLLANSITGVGGDSGIGIGEGETPEEADVKGYNVWDIDWTNND